MEQLLAQILSLLPEKGDPINSGQFAQEQVKD
jgi:hypothetical protein